MSNNKKRRVRRVRRAPKGSKRTDVGYGRPPREHQFKPGQSGYKRGRPKGSKNQATIVKEVLNRKIELRQNGKLRKISVQEGIILKSAEDALKGNSKAAAFLLNRASQLEASDQSAHPPVLDEDDQKVLDFFQQQLEEKLKRGGKK